MKIVILPEKVQAFGQSAATPDSPAKVVLIPLGLPDYLEACWADPYWRDGSRDRLACAVRTAPKFVGKEPGEKIELSDGDHEKIVECALRKGQEFPANNAVAFMTLLAALVNAEDKKDETPA